MTDPTPSTAKATATEQPSRPVRVWPTELSALVLITLNVLLSASLGMRSGYRGSELLGYTFAPVIIPVLAVGVASLSESKRNRLSRARIVLWVSVFLLFGQLGGGSGPR